MVLTGFEVSGFSSLGFCVHGLRRVVASETVNPEVLPQDRGSREVAECHGVCEQAPLCGYALPELVAVALLILKASPKALYPKP